MPPGLRSSIRIAGELVAIEQEFKRRDALLLPFLNSNNIRESSTAARATITIALEPRDQEARSDCREQRHKAYRAVANYRSGETVVYGAGAVFGSVCGPPLLSLPKRRPANNVRPRQAGLGERGYGRRCSSLRQNGPLQVTKFVTCAMKFWARRLAAVVPPH
jgi:hypothetical protein